MGISRRSIRESHCAFDSFLKWYQFIHGPSIVNCQVATGAAVRLRAFNTVTLGRRKLQFLTHVGSFPGASIHMLLSANFAVDASRCCYAFGRRGVGILVHIDYGSKTVVATSATHRPQLKCIKTNVEALQSPRTPYSWRRIAAK